MNSNEFAMRMIKTAIVFAVIGVVAGILKE